MQLVHHLIEDQAHRRLLGVLRHEHDVEVGSDAGRQVGARPVEHRGRDGVGVDLPEEREDGLGGRLAGAHLLSGVGDAAGDVGAEPAAVHLVADLPGLERRVRAAAVIREEVDEALLVLRAGVAGVEGRVDRLAQHLEALGFGVADQGVVVGRAFAGVEHDPHPPVRLRQRRGQVEVGLIVRRRVDRHAEPGRARAEVGVGVGRAVFGQQRVIGDRQLIERQIAFFALGRLGRAAGVGGRDVRDSRVVGCLEGGRMDVVRPRDERGIEPAFLVEGGLIGEVHGRGAREAGPAVVDDDERIAFGGRRPVEREGHRLAGHRERRGAGGRQRVEGQHFERRGVEERVVVVAGRAVVRGRAHLAQGERRAGPIVEQQRDGAGRQRRRRTQGAHDDRKDGGEAEQMSNPHGQSPDVKLLTGGASQYIIMTTSESI